MTWAFGQRVGSPMAKLVLLSLADHHDDETGTDPFPAIETIAAETEMNERSVRRHLATLEAAGLIARKARGRGKALPPQPPAEAGQRVHCRDADTGLCVIDTGLSDRDSGLCVPETGQRVHRTGKNQF